LDAYRTLEEPPDNLCYQRIDQTNITSDSQISTDGSTDYSGHTKEGFIHGVINQTKAEDKKNILPRVHLLMSPFKRIMLATFQGRFKPQYLQSYLDEYDFRFNRRT
jgi:hypothetical protein